MNDKICIHLICRNLKKPAPPRAGLKCSAKLNVHRAILAKETTKWCVKKKKQTQILKNMAAAN